MKYINKRNGDVKSTDFLQIIKGETRYRISEEYGEIVITKIDFDDDVIIIKPKVRNQISIE